jgi:predicted enzyme related to lactoylglutathione lyase
LGRAKKFYEETLGLKVVEEREEGIEFACGSGTALGIYPSGSAGTNQATAAEFDVEDLDGEMKELKDRGVTFEEYDFPGLKTNNGIAQLGDSRGSWFKDTEGNILALVERK